MDSVWRHTGGSNRDCHLEECRPRRVAVDTTSGLVAAARKSIWGTGKSKHSQAGTSPFARLIPLGLAGSLWLLVSLPWLRTGWLEFLDLPDGPRSNALVQGSPFQSTTISSIASTPLTDLIHIFDTVSVTHGAVIALLAFFLLAGVASANLIDGTLLAKLSGEALYLLNPWVMNRIYVGQLGILFAYAMLPLLLKQVLRAQKLTDEDDANSYTAWLTAGIALGVTAVFSTPFLWLGIAVLASVAILRTRNLHGVFGVGIAFITSILLLSYIPLTSTANHISATAGLHDLASFATRSGSYGLYLNIADLNGFWRTGPVTSETIFHGWPLLVLAMLLVCAAGLVGMRRRITQSKDPGRNIEWIISLIALLGFLLALGSQGPLGSAFTWLYQHVPYFDALREPDVAAALLALAYSLAFGWGIGVIATSLTDRRSLILFSLGVAAFLLAFEPVELFGLGFQVSTSTFPTQWAHIRQTIETKPGVSVALPWHGYTYYSFTHHETANLAGLYFGSNVITKVSSESYPVAAPYAAFDNNITSWINASAKGAFPISGVAYILWTTSPKGALFNALKNNPNLQLIDKTPSISLFTIGKGHELQIASSIKCIADCHDSTESDRLISVQDVKTVGYRSCGPGCINLANTPHGYVILPFPLQTAERVTGAVPVGHLENGALVVRSHETRTFKTSESPDTTATMGLSLLGVSLFALAIRFGVQNRRTAHRHLSNAEPTSST